MFCGINIIILCVGAIILTGVWLIIQKIQFLAPFKNIINILFAVIVAIFIIMRVLAPLLSCMG